MKGLFRLAILCSFVLSACSTQEASIPTLHPQVEAMACASVITRALDTVTSACGTTGRNEVCYGNRPVDATLRDGAEGGFTEPGNRAHILSLESLLLGALSSTSGDWGIVLLQVQAGLPDTLPGQNVTMLMFGDTSIRPQDSVEGVQAFYFQTAISGLNQCVTAPPDGLIVQTPEGAANVHFLLNKVLIELASTIFVQAAPDNDMTISVLEGQATVTAQGTSVVVPTGMKTHIPLDAQGFAAGVPLPPEPYDSALFQFLPWQPLERAIQILPPGSATNTPEAATPNASDTPAVETQAVATMTPFFAFGHQPQIQVFDTVEMVLVPPGCFMMGSTFPGPAQPIHQQCFLESFWIDRYEVTNGQFEQFGGQAALVNSACDEDNDGTPTPEEFPQCANFPRKDITWEEARDYCALRAARLPTEAEWEYAARGPENFIYPWGNEYNAENVIGFPEFFASPAEVGSRLTGVSWVGAFDMSGNVSEWVSSAWAPYPYVATDGREDLQGERTSLDTVLRGGSHIEGEGFLRADTRGIPDPGGFTVFYGLRCARSA